jgi:hypothetical protein
MSVSDISTARYPIKAESPQKGQNSNIKERNTQKLQKQKNKKIEKPLSLSLSLS